MNSGKVLDVAYGNTTSGANVWQYEVNNSNAQKWTIKDAGDGYYYIVSKCGRLCLDVARGKTSNGTNIRVLTANKSNSQKFKFKKNNLKGIDVSKFQGNINWSNVKKDKNDFAILRVGFRGYTSGKIVQDRNV